MKSKLVTQRKIFPKHWRKIIFFVKIDLFPNRLLNDFVFDFRRSEVAALPTGMAAKIKRNGQCYLEISLINQEKRGYQLFWRWMFQASERGNLAPFGSGKQPP